MDNFIPKGGVDSVRTTKPSKSPRVTREDGSHGNKGRQQDSREPVDQIDIDPEHLEEKPQSNLSDEPSTKTSTISLKMIRDAMVAQATKTQAPIDADPSYRQALSAYGTYASITAPPPELAKIDTDGAKTQFGKLSDLIDHGLDQVNIIRGQSHDSLINTLWDQRFPTS